jgi:hypothetical protein
MMRYTNYKTTGDLLRATDTEQKSEDMLRMTDISWRAPKDLPQSDPAVWGPAFWFTLHNGAIKYPVSASPLCASRMKGFIMGIPVMIPCEKCADHATAYIESIWPTIDTVVNSRTNLFKFFFNFHNTVNKRLGKPEMSYDAAVKMYPVVGK